MPDARCDELKGVGIYHDAKPGEVNDATDYSPWKLKLIALAGFFKLTSMGVNG
jgi:hypothetical protein